MTAAEARRTAAGLNTVLPGLPSVDRFKGQLEVWTGMVEDLSDVSCWALVNAIKQRYRSRGIEMKTTWAVIGDGGEV
jgi:hypothetical protein